MHEGLACFNAESNQSSHDGTPDTHIFNMLNRQFTCVKVCLHVLRFDMHVGVFGRATVACVKFPPRTAASGQLSISNTMDVVVASVWILVLLELAIDMVHGVLELAVASFAPELKPFAMVGVKEEMRVPYGVAVRVLDLRSREPVLLRHCESQAVVDHSGKHP